jgi:hypothetical protein
LAQRYSTATPTVVARRGEDFHVEIVVRRGKSYRANAYGTAACFGRAIDLGTAKRVRFKIKKITVLDLKFILEKSLGTAFRPLYHISITVVGAALYTGVTPGFVKNKTRLVICVPRKSTHTTTE